MMPSFHELLVRGVASYSLELFRAVALLWLFAGLRVDGTDLQPFCVRVDDFMKIIASDLPASGFSSYAPVRIRSARSRSATSSSRQPRSTTTRRSTRR